MVERVIVKIRSVRIIDKFREDGIEFIKAKLKVSPISAIPAVKIPGILKRRVINIERNYVAPYVPEIGDEIVLTREETEVFSSYFQRNMLTRENQYLKVSVDSLLGSRISSLIYKPLDFEFFRMKLHISEGKWGFKGGALDFVDDSRFGLWNSNFKITESGFLEHKLKNTELRKKFILKRNLPLLEVKLELRSRKKKKARISHYVSFNVNNSGGDTVFYYLSDRGIKYERGAVRSIPWPWEKTLRCDTTGILLFHKEKEGISLMIGMNPSDLEVVNFYRTIDGPELIFTFNREEISKKKMLKRRIIYIVGEKHFLDEHSFSVGARGINEFVVISSSVKPIRFFDVNLKDSLIKMEAKEYRIDGMKPLYIARIPIKRLQSMPEIKGVHYG
ncbi:MAG TPA: hypothetical protein ENL43_00095 [candidate division WOR-3 bacterium]|uniref:Uncharacterized protein n=1 Tax=candidate division WOR-3 bacterium TaxID=2052148 RepID=A0A7V5HMM6_UNCW3|nr:hypothetical protein [candidate division WOR-3 bacterium]